MGDKKKRNRKGCRKQIVQRSSQGKNSCRVNFTVWLTNCTRLKGTLAVLVDHLGNLETQTFSLSRLLHFVRSSLIMGICCQTSLQENLYELPWLKSDKKQRKQPSCLIRLHLASTYRVMKVSTCTGVGVISQLTCVTKLGSCCYVNNRQIANLHKQIY